MCFHIYSPYILTMMIFIGCDLLDVREKITCYKQLYNNTVEIYFKGFIWTWAKTMWIYIYEYIYIVNDGVLVYLLPLFLLLLLNSVFVSFIIMRCCCMSQFNFYCVFHPRCERSADFILCVRTNTRTHIQSSSFLARHNNDIQHKYVYKCLSREMHTTMEPHAASNVHTSKTPERYITVFYQQISLIIWLKNLLYWKHASTGDFSISIRIESVCRKSLSRTVWFIANFFFR